MKMILENHKFNTMIETSDWRYNASIVGLYKYFNYLVVTGKDNQENLYEIDGDRFYYDRDKITEENYLLFVESYFEDAMHHRKIEIILNKEDIEEIDKKMQANKSINAKIIMYNLANILMYSHR